MEQDLRIDPETGFTFSDRRSVDAKQNLNYKRFSDPQATTRDFSRPHTIPADEFEAATGKRHSDAVAEWEKNEKDREESEARAAHAAER
jgi:hypothetical protein